MAYDQKLKEIYVSDILDMHEAQKVSLLSWLVNRRHNGRVLFLDVTDSTGNIQVVVEKDKVPHAVFEAAKRTPLESCIFLEGQLIPDQTKLNEISLSNLEVVSPATMQISPRPRSNFDVFDPTLTDQLLTYRHLYIRNPKIMAILKFRSLLMKVTREWFDKNGFMEFDAPILTPTPLYDDRTALPIKIHKNSAFLTQCAGFYLEAAAQAFDRVYNLGPSFRGEESKSRRHLIEYWHIKAELLSGDRDAIIGLVEDALCYITTQCAERGKEILKPLGVEVRLDALKVPYARISYEYAIQQLQELGFPTKFGEAMSTAEEEVLSKQFDGPFWIVGIPRTVEPFPYVIDPHDKRLTRVADLIASNGCGELLGVAEKIHDSNMLMERMREKGKDTDPRYQYVREVHDAGCAPHIAFGMGLERLVRWLINVPHVRDAIPFPRVIGRQPTP